MSKRDFISIFAMKLPDMLSMYFCTCSSAVSIVKAALRSDSDWDSCAPGTPCHLSDLSSISTSTLKKRMMFLLLESGLRKS